MIYPLLKSMNVAREAINWWDKLEQLPKIKIKKFCYPNKPITGTTDKQKQIMFEFISSLSINNNNILNSYVNKTC